jgi:hypothetical protein
MDNLLRTGLWLMLLSALAHSDVLAVEVTYEFSTTISYVNSGAGGFPESLNAATVGDPITGRIQYEADSPAAANPLGGVFQLATYYPLNNVTVSIDVGGVVFDSWTGTLAALVWNDDPTSASLPGLYDGLLYVNITSPQDTRFKIGNLILPADTFLDETLPSGPVTGIHSLELGLPNSPWVDGSPFNLTQVVVPPPVTGDFDGDGVVDQSDYDVWFATFGSSDDLRADANGDGVVDAADYTIWRDRLGALPGLGAGAAGSASASSAAAPEPATLWLLLVGILSTCCRRRARVS